MPNLLQVYREKQANVYKRISAHTLPTKEVLQMQELNYRIFVIETFQAFCKSAPMGMDTKELCYHYQLVDSNVRFLLEERKFGPKADEAGQKKREAARVSLEKVIQDGRKRFSSFSPTKPEQYRDNIMKYVNTVLPVWMQYRNAYINL